MLGAAMVPYQLFFRDARDRVLPAPQECAYPNTSDAIRAARCALSEIQFNSVELWAGVHFLARFSREDLAR